jgi:hypothetical protein
MGTLTPKMPSENVLSTGCSPIVIEQGTTGWAADLVASTAAMTAPTQRRTRERL